jgi:hypothetical protein
MQQRPGRGRAQGSASMRTRRTNPALPGATLPTAPIAARSRQYIVEPQPTKRPNYGRRAILQLLGLGICLELLFLAFYPLLAGAAPSNDAGKQALLGLFPWLPRLYWTSPAMQQLLAHLPAFDLSNAGGNANVLLLLLIISFVLTLLAAQVGRRVLREKLSLSSGRTLFSVIFILTVLFGIAFAFAPAAMTHEMFLYGTYGRLITAYHVNPLAVNLTAFPHDLLQKGLIQGKAVVPTSGPAWIDISIPIVLLARDSVANVLLGFRLIGLMAHLVNALLIWLILAKLKPELRVGATVLYAWNPLVLLLSIAGMHQDAMVVLFILLAIVFFQRNSPILGWVLVLLAVLVNMLCLLLLPLVFTLLPKETRPFPTGRRVLWWLLLIGVSALVLVLAYAPYWQDWGISGLLGSLQHTFFQDSAVNSVDAVLLNLPIKMPVWLAWMTAPHHWTILAAITVGCLLLLGCWLADKVEFVVLFCGWVMLALLVLLPVYWPWFMLLPLALALCSTNGRTLSLVLMLTAGALLSYYFLLWQPTWTGQALVTIALPMIVWGWLLFFVSTWSMLRAREQEAQPVAVQRSSHSGMSRPTFPSRPSWPRRGR